MTTNTDDLRIQKTNELLSPEQLINDLQVSDSASKTVANARRTIHNILSGEDDRILAIVGPCSIHDPAAARDYAGRLKQVADRLEQDIFMVMRVYFEKPRTTVGWKGLINDPDLNNTFQINKGLHLARGLLSDLADMGMPTGTEYLDLISPQYYADLISWGAIGARTTERKLWGWEADLIASMATWISPSVAFLKPTGQERPEDNSRWVWLSVVAASIENQEIRSA